MMSKPFGLHPLVHEVEHDVVPAAHGGVNGGRAGDDEVPGVAQHTSVPWEKPDRRMRVLNRSGWVSISICRVNLVLNSGTATAPVGPRMGSSS